MASVAGWTLVECLVPRLPNADGGPGWATLAALVGKTAAIPLDGILLPIQTLNAAGERCVDDAARAAAYLRFVCNTYRRDGGPFRTGEALDQIPLAEPLADDDVAKLRDHVHSIRLDRGPDGTWLGDVSIQYAGGVFQAGMKVQPSGMVEMPENSRLVSLATIRRQHQRGAQRWLEGVYPPVDDKAENDED